MEMIKVSDEERLSMLKNVCRQLEDCAQRMESYQHAADSEHERQRWAKETMELRKLARSCGDLVALY